MKDTQPSINSVMPDYQKPSGSARQIFPGSNADQHRPSLIKRDSDIAAPHVIDMGGVGYSYAPPRNKKKM